MTGNIPDKAFIHGACILPRQSVDQGERMALNRDQHPVGTGRVPMLLRCSVDFLEHPANLFGSGFLFRKRRQQAVHRHGIAVVAGVIRRSAFHAEDAFARLSLSLQLSDGFQIVFRFPPKRGQGILGTVVTPASGGGD